jgi:general secretion pathway protein F
MPAFRYTAIDNSGRLARGTMMADTEADVVARLQRQGAIPMRAVPDTGWLPTDLLTREVGRRHLSRQEVTNITRELAVMLSAGQDLDRALRFLVETAPNQRVARVVGEVRDAVRGGAPLAAAMAARPRSFSPLYVGLARAGEAGGTLAPTLEHLAELLERQRSLTAAVTSALIYPSLLLLVAAGSVVLLLTKVLPQFVPLFQENGVQLPPTTQFMISASTFLTTWGLWLLFGLILFTLGLRRLLAEPGPGLVADRLLLRVPIFGRLVSEVLAARFTRTLGTLLLNGVPLIAALRIVREAIGNRAGVKSVDKASASAMRGDGLSGALAASGVFPLRTVYLLRLGEETAQLGPMALRAAAIHEEKARIGLQRLVSLLVPLITIVMGALIAGIISSLLLAMLKLNDLAR